MENWNTLKDFISNANSGSFQVFVEVENGASPKLLKADMTEEDAKDLGKEFLQFLTSQIVDEEVANRLAPACLSQDEELNPKILFYDYADPIAEINFLREINPLDLENFNFGTHQFEDIKAIVVTFGHGNRLLTMYKLKVPHWIFKRGKFMLIPMRERFERFQKDVLTIDKRFDFFIFDDKLLIFRLKTLESHFGFKEYRTKEAEKVFSRIDRNYFPEIEKTKILIRKYPDVAKKLAQLRNSPVLTVDKQKVIAFIRKKHGLELKVSRGKVMSTKTKAGFLRFLKVLNEDYLHSELTNKDYDSTVKKNIELE